MDESDRAKETTVEILDDVLGDYRAQGLEHAFTVRFWDGSVWPEEAVESAAFTLVLNHPGALRQMFLPPSELNLGESYIYGDFDVEGDLIAAFPLAAAFQKLDLGLGDKLGLAWKLRSLPNTSAPRVGRQAASVSGTRHSRRRDRQAISYHYDVSNDFYALWLDRNMVYSCGYFADPDEDIHTAQERKLDYICRKLRLEPGERLLDIGCGWGGLVTHAVAHYGVEALGITLSQPQVDFAQERIAEAALEDRCRVEVRDYREVEPETPFDKLVSVGMFEHVGEEKMRVYFEQAWDILRPEGVFLNHAITRPGWEPKAERDDTFSDRYVFPDGELTPISHSLRIAEEVGFEVRDVESLREHYALTLRRWVRRLEQRHEEALEHVDEVTYRIWGLFMSGSAEGFESARLNVYQSLLVKPGPDGTSGLPLTRADWY
ncbi:MAG: cyclopropane-fatty-acyl-phospholipid synthase family protein [Chloroflexota bacterium]|nr:cyclopropane-fatty-acyl-phospholipid synthase family protein [Chloroflexota bacterium]